MTDQKPPRRRTSGRGRMVIDHPVEVVRQPDAAEPQEAPAAPTAPAARRARPSS